VRLRGAAGLLAVVVLAVTMSASAPAASVRRCTAADLSARRNPAPGGLGHAGFILVLRNASSHTCALTGYPGLQRLTTSGRRVLTHVRRGTGYLFRDRGPMRVVLRPGATASDGVEWRSAALGSRACRTSQRLEVTPPDATRHLTIRAAVNACGGRISVTALRLGPRGPAA
jgi:hypothetical protein